MLSLSGHIGTKASALVDGQLSRAEEERAWSHVLTCPGCRRLVEHEGWTKRQLGSLGGTGTVAQELPPQLLGSLYAVDAWATVDAIEKRSRRRRTVAVVGGGAVAASVLGLLTVTGAPGGRTEVPARPSPATIRGSEPARGPVGSPTGAETNALTGLARRSR
jgi:hypothetical protein